jgi:hypothetical protein
MKGSRNCVVMLAPSELTAVNSGQRQHRYPLPCLICQTPSLREGKNYGAKKPASWLNQ